MEQTERVTPEEQVARLVIGAALQRDLDAAGVGRITTADREAGENVGQLLTECAWAGIPKQSAEPEHWTGAAEIALSVAAQVRATGSGFALALAEWLERWAGEERG